MKKLDQYIIKTFLGPFLFIFSVLFFIFIIQLAWNQLDKIAGKGLGILTTVELLFYLGINVIQLVLPLSILLGTIMTFGGFGERFELAAIKSTGISLKRVMMPLFIVVCAMAVGLFFFADRVMPFSQEKAKTMMYNLIRTKPTLKFQEGIFIEGIPKITLNIDKISGEKDEVLNGVFIQQNGNFNDNLRTIRAESGILESDSTKKHYLKMRLYNGFVQEEERKNQQKKKQQEYSITQFDTLQQFFDISDLIETKDDTLGRHYTFLNTAELKQRIDSVSVLYSNHYNQIAKINKNQMMNRFDNTNTLVLNKEIVAEDYQIPWEFDSLIPSKRQEIVKRALSNIDNHKNRYESQSNDVKNRQKSIGRHKLHYQRSFAYAFTCIIFFLVGAPLGAIVKKGGIGMPVVISIIIFALFFIVNIIGENNTKSGVLNGHVAAWMANVLFLPVGIFLVILSNKDSDFLTSSIYTEKISKFFKSLVKSNTYVKGIVNFLEKLFPSDDKEESKEHERYQ